MLSRLCASVFITSVVFALFLPFTVALVSFNIVHSNNINNNSNNNNSSSINNSSHSHTYSYPTQDPYEVRVKAYYATGLLLPTTFDSTAKCKLLVPASLPNFLYNSTAQNGTTSNYTESVIITVNAADARTNGCITVAHAGIAAYDFGQSLLAKDGINLPAILYLLPPDKYAVPGAPHHTHYYSRKLIFPAGAPPVNMAIMPIEDYWNVVPKNTTVDSPISVVVKQESGPWNDVFLSNYYLAFIYILAVINACFAIYGLANFVYLLRFRQQRSKQRIAIFIFAFIAAILFSIALPMGTTSQFYVCALRIIGFMQVTGFQLLLLLWHDVLAKIKNSLVLKMVKFGLLFGLTLTNIWLLIFTVVTAISDSQRTREIINYIMSSMVFVQLITILVIAYYGFTFWLKRNTLNISKNTRKALGLISNVCAIALVGASINFVNESLRITYIWRYGVAADAIRIVTGHLAITISNIALLSVFYTHTAQITNNSTGQALNGSGQQQQQPRRPRLGFPFSITSRSDNTINQTDNTLLSISHGLTPTIDEPKPILGVKQQHGYYGDSQGIISSHVRISISSDDIPIRT
ncbi:hypothetical protein BDF19DRAFT_445484 [Syncephalis fuscata]|nr:hypothetical protein BDF19DRAFT_445484 [Syncephalis fuscata]